MPARKPVVLRSAVVLAVASLGGLAVAATTSNQVSSKRTDDNISVSSNGPAVTSSGNDGTSSATFDAVSKFDRATGVLTGVNAKVETTTGSFQQTGVGGVSSLNASWTIAGQTTTGTPASRNSSGNTTTFSQLVLAAPTLSSFLYTGSGSSTVAGSVAYTVSADKTASSGGSTSASYSRPPAGANPNTNTRQTVSYDYLQHANASFDGSTDVNELTVTAGSSFDVFALAGSLGAGNTTKLDSVSFTCVSALVSCSAFNFSLAPFQDLAAGSFVTGTTSLAASLPGRYAAQYLLTFIDDTSVGVGHLQNTLTLNVEGTISAVPEPESYAMMLAGLGAMGFLARRRRQA